MMDNIERLYAEAEVLLSAALEAEAQEAGAQFQRACEIYAKILAINPGHYDALSSWGYALTSQATQKPADEADRLCCEAIQKYAQAVSVAPTHKTYFAYYLWGDALVRRGCLQYSGSQARQLFEEACGKFSAAHELNSASFVVLKAWASALSCLAEEASGEGEKNRATALYSACVDKFSAAAGIAEQLGHADQKGKMCFCLARALLQSALEGGASDIEKPLDKACAAFKEGARIRPNEPHALFLWGLALGLRADSEESASAIVGYRAACDKFEASLGIDPNQPDALSNWARSLLVLTLLEPKDKIADLLAQSEALLQHAEELQPGSNTYLYACFAACSEDFSSCRHHLENAKLAGCLPGKDVVEQDRLMVGVKNQVWFSELFPSYVL